MKKSTLVVLLSVLLMTACASAGPDIEIDGAWVRPDPLMQNAAGYAVIRNHGSEPDALVDVRAEFANMVELHQSKVVEGVHKMDAVGRLEIPAGGQVELRPLSYHVMLMGLNSELVFGESVTFVLLFEKSGELVVEAEIRKE